MNRPSIADLRGAYLRGENILSLLAVAEGPIGNSFDSLQLAYDLQAGSYSAIYGTAEGLRHKAAFAEALVPSLDGYGTILDAGVGEALTLAPVLARLSPEVVVSGFDASVSRLQWARRNLASVAVQAQLFVADTAEIPLRDGSVDAVLSVHSLEPNGGRERELLAELLRVAARRVVLIEPSSVFGSKSQIERMRRLGYCMDLPSALEDLGATISLHEPWQVNINPANVAELIIVEVPQSKSAGEARTATEAGLELVAPASLADLEAADAGLYSRQDGLYFPIVGGFPILTRRQAVIATQLLDGF